MEVPTIFLSRILAEAAKRGAADLHLTVGSLPQLRVDNQLLPLAEEEIVTTELLNKIITSILADEERQYLEKERGVILVKNLAGNFRFRLNLFYQKDLPSISFHYIPMIIKTPADLKLPEVLNDFFKLNSGLLVIAGPYGAGKTTTAASLIEEINKNYKKNIVTIEQPIEYLFINKKSVIIQREVGRDVKNHLQALEYCLNEDIDLVYLGEIRDDQTFVAMMSQVLELAAGNSLVILEVNADSAIKTLEKILAAAEKHLPAEAARYNLVDVLLAVIVQKLIPHRGGGLVLACEILLNNSAVKSLIREGRIYQLESVLQTSRKEGMISMAKSLETLIQTGEVRQEDAT